MLCSLAEAIEAERQQQQQRGADNPALEDEAAAAEPGGSGTPSAPSRACTGSLAFTYCMAWSEAARCPPTLPPEQMLDVVEEVQGGVGGEDSGPGLAREDDSGGVSREASMSSMVAVEIVAGGASSSSEEEDDGGEGGPAAAGVAAEVQPWNVIHVEPRIHLEYSGQEVADAPGRASSPPALTHLAIEQLDLNDGPVVAEPLATLGDQGIGGSAEAGGTEAAEAVSPAASSPAAKSVGAASDSDGGRGPPPPGMPAALSEGAGGEADLLGLDAPPPPPAPPPVPPLSPYPPPAPEDEDLAETEPSRELDDGAGMESASPAEGDGGSETAAASPVGRTLSLQQSISPRSTGNLLGIATDGEENLSDQDLVAEEEQRPRSPTVAAVAAAAEHGVAPSPRGLRPQRQVELQEDAGETWEPAGTTDSTGMSPAGSRVSSPRPPAEESSAGAAPSASPLQSPSSVPPPPLLLHPLPFLGSPDIADALFSLLSAPLLPVPSLWHASYLLSQVCLRRASENAAASPVSGSRPDASGDYFLLLSPEQRSALQVALDEAVSRALDELGSSMWCDAVFPVLCMEWPVAAEAAARPLLRAGAEVLMAGPALYPPRPEQGGKQAAAVAAAAKAMGLSGSAAAALHVYHSVQRLVSALQLRQLVRSGAVEKQPPVPVPPEWELRGLDVSEGHQVCGGGPRRWCNDCSL